jgi:hypothetical protein
MNADDPKLTAFALGELDESERSTIARAIAESPEAQRYVDETREFSRALKNGFAAEISNQKPMRTSRNLIDIRDDPWFWSRARPLAVAACIAILAVVIGIAIGTYVTRHNARPADASRVEYADVEGEEKAHTEAPAELNEPRTVPNPLRRDAIQRIDRVVIGEIDGDSDLESSELRVIEMINDAYRIQRLKERLAIPTLSKKLDRGLVGHAYELMFLDRNGQVVASATFFHAPGFGFVLQPSQFGYERDGHYFAAHRGAVLAGDWKSNVNYLGYVIPFPDWSECVGYSPGA